MIIEGLTTAYNPLDKGNLGVSVREALLKQPIGFMSDLLRKTGTRTYCNKFAGAGTYAIYYTGNFQAYKVIAEQNRDEKFEAPIYVGKAVPQGARKGGLLDSTKGTEALFKRLRTHARSIQEVSNLDLADFYFRYLIVDDIWIPLGETYMIEKFQPVWNKVGGFGNNTPGKRRKDRFMSEWDTVHPGRSYVAKLSLPPNLKTSAQIVREIENYLVLPQEEKAKLPVVDDGEPEQGDEPDM